MSSNPVLLVHGFTTSARRTWAEVGWIDILQDAGREVIAVDLLGHGDAPKPHDEAAYEEVEALVLAALPEGQQVDAVGYSAGARVVLYLAATHPERFGRLVVGGVGARLFEERTENPILAALRGEGDPEDLVAQHFLSLANTDGNDPEALAAFVARTPPPLTRDMLAEISAPTLVIIGDKDFAGPGEPLAEALPDGELLTLKGVDHFGLLKNHDWLFKSLGHLGV